MPKPPQGERALTDAERAKRYRDRLKDAGNCSPVVWVPNNPEAKQALQEFCAELRRQHGTFLPGDLVL